MPALPLDRLADGASFEVLPLDGLSVGGTDARPPHRHDYHELLWIRSGAGVHLLDGEEHPVVPGAVTVIGRGQVHVFARGTDLHGAVVRFGEELAPRGAAWLLAARGARTVAVPGPRDAEHVDAVVAALRDEAERPADVRTDRLIAGLLGTLLLWLERWYDDAHTERPVAGTLHRRFAAALEEDFARHHDAGHYADRLGVPAAALSRSLADVTGRGTKELVTDRVMLEARRLLRFTDRPVGTIAHEVGFEDPLYFSRAFKRHQGLAPQAWREKSMHR